MKLITASCQNSTFGILIPTNTYPHTYPHCILLPNNKTAPYPIELVHLYYSVISITKVSIDRYYSRDRMWIKKKVKLVYSTKKVSIDSSFILSKMGKIIIHHKFEDEVVIVSEDSYQKCSFSDFKSHYDNNSDQYQHNIKLTN